LPRSTRVLLTLAAATLAACGASTEIRGTVQLDPGQSAPDAAPHRLVVAAFAHGDLVNGMPLPGTRPITGLYATVVVSNGAFAQRPIAFDLTSFGGCPDADVIAWWKVHDAPGEDGFIPLAVGDRVTKSWRVFVGSDGSKRSFASNVDLNLFGTLMTTSGGTPALPGATPAATP